MEQNNLPKNCPYLGIESEPGSCFGLPTGANFCHKAKPIHSVKREYQAGVCLAKEHPSCPVFQLDWEGPLPPEAKGGRTRKSGPARFLWRGLVLSLFVLAVIGVFLLLMQPGMFTLLSRNFENTMLESIISEDTPTSLALIETQSPPTSTQTRISFTATAEKSPTNPATSTATAMAETESTPIALTPTPELVSSTPGPGLQTPFGPQGSYLLHLISEGESMPVIAGLYDTNSEMILALNEWVELLGLRANRVIVLMPGVTNPHEVVPLTVEFTQDDISSDNFASAQGISIEDLRYYNQLGTNETIPAGRWLIFPFQSETPTLTVTAVPTPDLSKALTSPFGPNDEYVLHQVVNGDSLATLAKLYLTKIEVIQAVNIINGSIQLEQVLVILPEQQAIIESPRFEVINVETAARVEKLASDLGVLYADIIYYNNLAQGQEIEAGSWIIYPNPDEK